MSTFGTLGRCLFAGFGFSVWINVGRYVLRENGYVSRITREHAATLAKQYGFTLPEARR